VSRSRFASPRISENSRSVSSTCSLFLMPLETGFAAAFPGPSSHSITRSYRGSAMFRLLPAIEPAFEIHMPPNAGTSDPDSGCPYILQGFSCKPRPPTVALMNSEFRLFIMRSQRSVGFALRPRKADSGRVPGDRAARHPRERSARRSPSAPRPARTISSRSPNPRQTHRSQTHKCMHLGLSDDLYADLQRFPLSRSSHFNFSGSQRLCFNEKKFLPRLPACPRCCR
jgi:hypothetical protein